MWEKTMREESLDWPQSKVFLLLFPIIIIN